MVSLMLKKYGRVPKWTKGVDCKSTIRRFESGPGLLISRGGFGTSKRHWLQATSATRLGGGELDDAFEIAAVRGGGGF
jgi:hypothetical protein